MSPKYPKPTTMEQVKCVMPNMYRQVLREPLSFFCQIIVPIILVFVGCLVAYLYFIHFFIIDFIMNENLITKSFLGGDSEISVSSLVLSPSIYAPNWQIPYMTNSTASNFTSDFSDIVSIPTIIGSYQKILIIINFRNLSHFLQQDKKWKVTC